MQAIRAAHKSDPDLFEEPESTGDLPESAVVAKSESEPPKHAPLPAYADDEDLSGEGMPTPRVNAVFGRTDSDLASTNSWAAVPFENTAPRPIVVLSDEDSIEEPLPMPAKVESKETPAISHVALKKKRAPKASLARIAIVATTLGLALGLAAFWLARLL